MILALAGVVGTSAAGATGLPLAPEREIVLDVTSGTWMSLDVAPDGEIIVFDLLGDLHRMSISGGRAEAITQGLAVDTQPALSPDGGWIAFVSDRSGSDNLWVMRADGTQARQLTFADDETVFVSPSWNAGGNAIYVSRFWPSLFQYELLRQPLDGPATIVAPIRSDRTTPREEWQSTLGVSASRDGNWLYFARHTGPLRLTGSTVWSIVRRDLRTGEEETVIGGLVGRGVPQNSAFSPQLSSDGGRLAYAMHRNGQTELRIRNLADGSDWMLAILDPDQQQAVAWQDFVPSFAFAPDGQNLYISRAGRFERVSTEAAPVVQSVPFRASVEVALGPTTRIRLREEQDPVRPRMIQAPITSPDGEAVAFSALASVWVQDLSRPQRVRRISGSDQAAFQPSWSPDGRHIAYVTWNESDGGQIWTASADGAREPRPLTSASAYYSYPVYTPDGRSMLAFRSATAARQQTVFEFGKLRQSQLISIPIEGGTPHVVTEGRIGGRPHFAREQGSVYILTGEGLASVNLASGATRTVAQVRGPGYYFQEESAPADDMRISPDGRSLLAQITQQLYLLPVPPATDNVVDLIANPEGVRRLSDIGADYFEWRGDGGIDWSVGSHFVHLPDAMASLEAQTVTEIAFTVPRAIGRGDLVLRGGRILPMTEDDPVIDDGEIWISDGRFRAVGSRGELVVPADVPVMDMTGRTIIPGLIDAHDHIGSIRREVLSLDDWGLQARLAWGVTTSFDPSTLSIDMLIYQDLLDAGRMIGPRLRSTGPAVFSFNRFDSLDEVRTVLTRYRDAYRLGNIKEYRTGNRRVRQWMAIAAREMGLFPTTEGALALRLDLSQILDGFAGHEHALPAVPLGEDMIALLAATRTSYTTTLMTTNSGPPGDDWFIARYDLASDPKIARFWPPYAIEQRLFSRPWVTLREQRFPAVAAGAAAVAEAGGLVGIGSHGEVPGPGIHWEMEAHVMGGMTPLAVLHAATAGSAETIGRLDDLGTIEPGKIADLVVLDADPRDDIRNTQRIAAVMRDGRLFDGSTLDERWPEPHASPPTWFHRENEEIWLSIPVE